MTQAMNLTPYITDADRALLRELRELYDRGGRFPASDEAIAASAMALGLEEMIRNGRIAAEAYEQREEQEHANDQPA